MRANEFTNFTYKTEPYEGWNGDGIVVRAYDGGTEVGHVIFEPTEDDNTQWYAVDVEVEEPYQRKGIATKMYDIAKKSAKQQGAIIVKSHTQTDAGRGLWQDKQVWEQINESKTTLNNMYGGHFPDRDETFWDYVTPRELGQALTVETMQKHKVLIMLLSQYRAEHIDDITDMLDDDQQEIVQSYVNDPTLSSKTIVVANNKIIDGNHRALAAAIKGVPINYVNLAELDEEPIDESTNDAAKSWIEKVYAKYPHTMQNNHVMVWGEGDDQQFAMFELTPSFSKRGAVEVKWFQAYPLRQGVGSRAMKELQALAREDGITLTLFPWDKGQVSQSKLTKFYKGQGFTPTVKGGKAMSWAPEIDEADSKSQYAHEIALKLQDAGYKKLGIGADATVWSKDDNYVIKILMPDDPSSQAERVFQKFYEFCQQHPKLSCLPKFNEVNTIDIGGKDYTQIEMEKLTPIINNTFEEAMVWALSDMVSKNLSWETVVQELLNPKTWYGGMTRVMRKMPIFVRQRMNSPEFNKTYSQLYEVMRHLYQTGEINDFGWDLHTENIMQRSNGQLVIIDPWFITQKGSR